MSDSAGPAPQTDRTRRRTTWVVAAIALVGVSLVAGLGGGWALTRDPVSTPTEESADAGFARDMSAHHAQAVRMSVLVLEDSTDPQVRTLATDIMLTQQQQVGQMYGWLDMWGLPQTPSGPRMAWMAAGAGGHAGMDMGGATSDGSMPGMTDGSMPGMTDGSMPGTTDGSMPGMASAQDLQRLEALSGPEADRLYLQLMIPHHRGGVQMAQAAAQSASSEQVRRLARTIVTSQTAELEVLTQMLDDRGGPLT